MTIHPARVQALNDAAPRPGRFVLYWMQASCRAGWNHALEHAILRANELPQPVVACFGLTPGFPEANARHYTFLLEGLRDARAALARRGIPLVVRRGDPDAVAAELAREASLVVTDRGYLRIQREWRARAARSIACPLVQVESDVVVPVESASHQEEYSAATLRPKIRRLLREFLTPLRRTAMRSAPHAGSPESLDLSDIPALVRGLGVDASVPPVAGLTGGSGPARRRLDAFVRRKLSRYHRDRNDPALDGQSGLGADSLIVADPNHAKIERFVRHGKGAEIAAVDDRRGVAPEVLGTTGVGMQVRPATMKLDRPVAGFVREALGKMLAPAAADAPRLHLVLEKLELGCRGRLIGSTRVYLDVRVAVSVEAAGGLVPAGWLEYFKSSGISMSARGKQAALFYESLAEMAGALDRGSLPLDAAGPPGAALPTVRLGMTGPELNEARRELESEGAQTTRQIEVRGTYRAWTDPQMKNAYGEAYGAAVNYTEWFWNREGVRVSTGWFSAEGQPETLDPSWTILSSSLLLGVVPVEVTWLHALSRGRSAFLPYGGLGISGFFGRESMELDAERPGESVAGEMAGVRASFGVHALLGAQIGLPGPFCLLAEASWTQAGLGTFPSPTFETDADRAAWEAMSTVARMPDFNHTGFGATIGFGFTER